MRHSRRVDHSSRFQLDVLVPKPLEQSSSVAEQDRDEVDLHLIEQPGAKDLLGDVRATGHRYVLVSGGCAGPPERRFDPAGDEGERRSTLFRHRLSRVVREDAPSPPLNIRLPIRTAPVLASDSSTTSELALVAPPDRPWGSRQLASANAHSWSPSPPSPSGCSRLAFGPATNPSSDVEMSSVRSVIVIPSSS